MNKLDKYYNDLNEKYKKDTFINKDIRYLQDLIKLNENFKEKITVAGDTEYKKVFYSTYF